MCWALGATLAFSAAVTNSHAIDNDRRAAIAESMETLTAHNCEEHMKLHHSHLGDTSGSLDLDEEHRNRDHRYLCEQLKQKVRIAMNKQRPVNLTKMDVKSLHDGWNADDPLAKVAATPITQEHPHFLKSNVQQTARDEKR